VKLTDVTMTRGVRVQQATAAAAAADAEDGMPLCLRSAVG